MDTVFTGFGAESFDFFRKLAENNNRSWFERNRERYDKHIVGAFRGLLAALEPFLLKLNPHFETGGKTNQNFSRINRDVRFTKDKSPYKSNYYLYAFDSRRTRQTDGRLYVGLNAQCVTVGFAIYGTWGPGPKGALDLVFRKRFASHREVFRRLAHEIIRGRRYETYWHRQEKREWAQHPGLPRKDEDWQTLQAWIVRKVFLPNSRGLATFAFVRQVESIFRELYPLYVFTSVGSARWRTELRSAA